MAMTKKDKEQFAELERKLAIARAMRFTDRVMPDVSPPYGNAMSMQPLCTDCERRK